MIFGGDQDDDNDPQYYFYEITQAGDKGYILPDIRKVKNDGLENPEAGGLTRFFGDPVDQPRNPEDKKGKQEQVKADHEPECFVAQHLH